MSETAGIKTKSKIASLLLSRRALFWLLALLAALALPHVIANDYYLDMIILILMWAALAEAYNISGGYGGQFSLGHSAFLGIGAYTSTILFWKLGISPWLGMIPGALFAAVVALLLGGVTLRLRGPFLGLASLAFTEVAHIVAVNWRSMTRGSEGIGVPYKPGLASMVFSTKAEYFYLVLVFAGGTVLITWLISRSRLGHYLVAVRENQEAARSLGVHTTKIKVTGLVISALLTAIGGTFYAQYILYIDPASLISFDVSIKFPLIAVVGGLGTVWGPVLGAAIMIPLSQVLRSTLSGSVSGLDLALYGLLLILVVLFMPQGLLVEIQQRVRRWRTARGGDHAGDH
jgi:branched-chain amino acid transport system permease protein